MEVILKQDVKGTGKAGKIVKVSDGYEVNNSTAHHELDVDGGSGRVSVELYRK